MKEDCSKLLLSAAERDYSRSLKLWLSVKEERHGLLTSPPKSSVGDNQRWRAQRALESTSFMARKSTTVARRVFLLVIEQLKILLLSAAERDYSRSLKLCFS